MRLVMAVVPLVLIASQLLGLANSLPADIDVQCPLGEQITAFDGAVDFTCSSLENEGCVRICPWSDGYDQVTCEQVGGANGFGATISYAAGFRRFSDISGVTRRQVRCCFSNAIVEQTGCNYRDKDLGVSWAITEHAISLPVLNDLQDRTDAYSDFFFEVCPVTQSAGSCSPCNACLNGGTCADRVAGNNCQFPTPATDHGVDCGSTACPEGICIGSAFECTCTEAFEGSICETAKCPEVMAGSVYGAEFDYSDGNDKAYHDHESVLTQTCRDTNAWETPLATSDLVCDDGSWIGTNVVCNAICSLEGQIADVYNGVIEGVGNADDEYPDAVLFGYTLQIKCAEGYVVEGTGNLVDAPVALMATCGFTRWDQLLTDTGSYQCFPTKCDGASLSITDGYFQYHTSAEHFGAIEGTLYPHMYVASVVCDAGHRLLGDNNAMVCLDGAWTGSLPSCEPLPCGDVFTGKEVVFPFQADEAPDSYGLYPNGTVVTLDCPAPSTDPSGGSNSSVCVLGQWEGVLPECSLDACATTQTNVSNGEVLYEDGGAHGTGRVVICDDGFTTPVGGNSTDVCNNGEWKYELDDCVADVCAAHLHDDLGTFTYSEEGVEVSSDWVAVDGVAELSCASGYMAQPEQATMVCVNGQWEANTTVPYCKLKGCSWAPSVHPNSTLLVLTAPYGPSDNVSGPNYEAGDVGLVQCNEGFEIQDESNRASMCIGGVWTRDPITTQCVMKGCTREHLYVRNGTVDFSDGGDSRYADVEVIASVTCDEGFILDVESEQNATCMFGGYWSPVPLSKCIPEMCALDVTEPEGGHINYTRTTESGAYDRSSAMVVCDDDHNLVNGSGFYLCEAGTWVASLDYPASCIPKGCEEALFAGNGNITYVGALDELGLHGNGTTASLSCDSGYVESGSFSAECVLGEWQISGYFPPNCTAVSCNRSEAYALMNAESTFTLISFSDGGAGGSADPGTVATPNCSSPLFDVKREDVVAALCCQAGEWENPHGSDFCSLKSCPADLHISHGSVSYTDSCDDNMCPSMTTVNITCDEHYYAAYQSADITCSAGFWTYGFTLDAAELEGSLVNNLSYPMCLEKNCSESQTRDGNGTLVYDCSAGYPKCTRFIVCDKGYQHDRDGDAQYCFEEEWIGSYPVCEEEHCNVDLEVPNGVVEYIGDDPPNPVEPGTRAKVNCSEGYEEEGQLDAEIVCQLGVWSDKLPRCVPLSCDSEDLNYYSNTSTASFNQDAVTGTLYPHGTHAEAYCKPGYQIMTDHADYPFNHSICDAGTWYPNELVIFCEPASCDISDQFVANGTISWSLSSLEHGGSITGACNEGFETDGPTEAMCQLGQWNETLSDCTEIACNKSDNSVTDGLYEYSDGSLSNESGTVPPHTIGWVVCDDGHYTPGGKQHHVVCIGGDWYGSGGSDSCSEKPCFDDPDFDHEYVGYGYDGPVYTGDGSVSDNGKYNTYSPSYNATRVCPSGFDVGSDGTTAAKSNVLTCQLGEWSGSYDGSPQSTALLERCYEEKCNESDTTRENGVIHYEATGDADQSKTAYRQKRFLECDAQYELDDLENPNLQMCVEGSWVGDELPHCEEVKCDTHALEVEGDHVIVTYSNAPDAMYRVPHLTYATWSCESGYWTGYVDEVPSCVSGVWNDTLPVCKPLSCNYTDLVSGLSAMDGNLTYFTAVKADGVSMIASITEQQDPYEEDELSGARFPHGRRVKAHCAGERITSPGFNEISVICNLGIWQYKDADLTVDQQVCFWPCEFYYGDTTPETLCYNNGQSQCANSFRSYDGTITDGEDVASVVVKRRRKRAAGRRKRYTTHWDFDYRGMRQQWRFRFQHDEYLANWETVDLFAPYYHGGVGTWYCKCPQHRTGIYCEYGCPDRVNNDSTDSVYVSNYVRVVDRCYMDVTMFHLEDAGSDAGLMTFADALAWFLSTTNDEIGYLPNIYDNRSRDHFTEFIHEHAGINYDTAWEGGGFSVEEAHNLDAQHAGFNSASERQYWTAFQLGGGGSQINYCWDQQQVQDMCTHDYCLNPYYGFENTWYYRSGAKFMYDEALHKFDCIALRQHAQAPSNFILDFVDCEEPLFPAIGTHSSEDGCNGTVVDIHCFTIYEGGRLMTFDDAYRVVGLNGDALFLGGHYSIPSYYDNDDQMNEYKTFADANDNIGTWLPLRINSDNGSCYQFVSTPSGYHGSTPIAPTEFNENRAPYPFPITEGDFQYALNALLYDGGLKVGVAMTYSANGEWHVVSKAQTRYVIAESRLWNADTDGQGYK